MSFDRLGDYIIPGVSRKEYLILRKRQEKMINTIMQELNHYWQSREPAQVSIYLKYDDKTRDVCVFVGKRGKLRAASIDKRLTDNRLADKEVAVAGVLYAKLVRELDRLRGINREDI